MSNANLEILQVTGGLNICRVFGDSTSLRYHPSFVYTEVGLRRALANGLYAPNVRISNQNGLEAGCVENVNNIVFRHPAGASVKVTNYSNRLNVKIGADDNCRYTNLGNENLGANIVEHFASLGQPTHISLELALVNGEYAIKMSAEQTGLILCLDVFSLFQLRVDNGGQNYIISQSTPDLNIAREILVRINNVLMNIPGVHVI